MKNYFKTLLALIAFSATLFSFSTIGGDSYTIHLNNKLIAQYYVASKEAIPSISISRASGTDLFSIYYSECGAIGKDRKLAVKDEKDNILKEWHFANAIDEHTPMTCKASEIISLKRTDSNKLKLVYSSREVSRGRLLAIIVFDELKAQK